MQLSCVYIVRIAQCFYKSKTDSALNLMIYCKIKKNTFVLQKFISTAKLHYRVSAHILIFYFRLCSTHIKVRIEYQNKCRYTYMKFFCIFSLRKQRIICNRSFRYVCRLDVVVAQNCFSFPYRMTI